MTEYIITETDFKEEIIDFINYVFSQSYHPHDFKTISPKSYSDEVEGLGAVHYLAMEDGKIKALVAARIIDVSFCGLNLKYSVIGNVSVHPYSRGKGYMKKLMNMALEDAKARNIDIMVLGGRRQRYQYFGFENAGSQFSFKITEPNIRHCCSDIDSSIISFRPLDDASETEIDKALELYQKSAFHCLRPRDEFRIIMKTWNSPCFILYKYKEMIGYAFGPHQEIVLEDDKDFPFVLKAIFEYMNTKEIKITVPIFCNERINYLYEICQNCSIETVEMINILNHQKVLDTLLKFRASYQKLRDGVAEISIEGEAFRITVLNGAPAVERIRETVEQDMSKISFVQKFFDIPSAFFDDEKFKNWLPLPFLIDEPDCY